MLRFEVWEKDKDGRCFIDHKTDKLYMLRSMDGIGDDAEANDNTSDELKQLVKDVVDSLNDKHLRERMGHLY